MKYEVVKHWVTGERAEKDEDVVKTELEDLMCEYMEFSGQRKVFWTEHVQPTKGSWKLGRSHTDKSHMTCIVVRSLSVQVRGQSPSCDLP